MQQHGVNAEEAARRVLQAMRACGHNFGQLVGQK
jgi:hypothetical protein